MEFESRWVADLEASYFIAGNYWVNRESAEFRYCLLESYQDILNLLNAFLLIANEADGIAREFLPAVRPGELVQHFRSNGSAAACCWRPSQSVVVPLP